MLILTNCWMRYLLGVGNATLDWPIIIKFSEKKTKTLSLLQINLTVFCACVRVHAV